MQLLKGIVLIIFVIAVISTCDETLFSCEAPRMQTELY
jgi:hypothetical protein